MAVTDDAGHGADAVVVVDDEAGLVLLAARLAAALPARAFVALEGDLGAGKTTFVKALAGAVGVDPAEVTSPTFGLVHLHDFPGGRLVHADLYRLGGSAELAELGWEELVAAPGWVVVEWASRAPLSLPPERVDVVIDILSETGRRFTFTPRGPLHRPLVAALAGERPSSARRAGE